MVFVFFSHFRHVINASNSAIDNPKISFGIRNISLGIYLIGHGSFQIFIVSLNNFLRSSVLNAVKSKYRECKRVYMLVSGFSARTCIHCSYHIFNSFFMDSFVPFTHLVICRERIK